MDLRFDTRSQSVQIGAVLLFGILVVLFSVYQGFVVPGQNQEIEFNHQQDVERDMIDLRSAVLEAKTTGTDQFSTVQLGTEYPSRTIARNPPDPGGTLRTTDNKTVQVDAGGDSLRDIFPDIFTEANRFIEYEPDYAEFTDASTIRYENTVVYKDFGEQNIVRSEQRLLRNSTVSLVPLQQELRASGRQTVSVEPIPGQLVSDTVDDPEITLATELTEENWEDLLADEIRRDSTLDTSDVTVANGNLTLTLTGTYTLEYAPVGINEAPAGGQRVQEEQAGSGSGSGAVNQAGPGSIKLVDERLQRKSDVVLTFNNTGETDTFTDARISFYQSAENNPNTEPNYANITAGAGTGGTATQLVFRERITPLNDEIELPGAGQETKVTLNFVSEQGGDNPNLDSESWFVLEFELESGERARYFVAVPE